MTERDKNGRFTSAKTREEEQTKNTNTAILIGSTILIVVAALVAGYCGGFFNGEKSGYDNGIFDGVHRAIDLQTNYTKVYDYGEKSIWTTNDNCTEYLVDDNNLGKTLLGTHCNRSYHCDY